MALSPTNGGGAVVREDILEPENRSIQTPPSNLLPRRQKAALIVFGLFSDFSL